MIGFDHVVLLCRDTEASLAFYGDRLGMEILDAEQWRRGEAFFPSVRVDEHTIIDLLQGEADGRNSDHICLRIEPTDLHALAARPDLDVVEGPVMRGGAYGAGWSVYVRDPDGYLVELKQYGTDATGKAEPGTAPPAR